MNFNLLGVIALCAGIILIYAGVTKKDPRTIVKEALTGKGKKDAEAKADSAIASSQAAISAAQKLSGGAQPDKVASPTQGH